MTDLSQDHIVFDELAIYGHPIIDRFKEFQDRKVRYSTDEWVSYLIWLNQRGYYEPWVKSVFTETSTPINFFTRTHAAVQIYAYGSHHYVYAVIPWFKVFQCKEINDIPNHYDLDKWLKNKIDISIYSLENDSVKIDSIIRLLRKRNINNNPYYINI